MKRLVIYITLALCSIYFLSAQELNLKLNINTQKISTAGTDIFKEMETSINQLLNDSKWTNSTFGRNERIDCSITILINEMLNNNSFKGEITITSRRPVYNSSYMTTLFNFRDANFSFDYVQGQNMNFSDNSVSDNLTAVLAFYTYIIIGLDFDSFAPNGGKPFFVQAMNIANASQILNTSGWEAFQYKNNRYDIATALTDESLQEFHTIWYNYHRIALDQMSANPQRSRIRVVELVNELKKLQNTRSASTLFSILGEAKLDEIVRICSECTAEEKREVYNILQSMFPAKSDILKNLR